MSRICRAKQIESGEDAEPANDYAAAYLSWKEWDAEPFAILNKWEEADFAANIRRSRISFPPNSQVLEIGFGNGSFLAYGRKQKWEICGTELNPELVECARQQEFRAVLTPDLNDFPDDSFNLVAAFDVLEHLPEDRILECLRDIGRVLREGGIFIARFPNGDSPFARFHQHGDPTHLTTIGSLKARYYAKALGFDLIYVGAEVKPLLAGPLYFAHRIFANPVKYMMNLFLNLIFCPRAHVSFASPNLVMIVRVRESLLNRQ